MKKIKGSGQRQYSEANPRLIITLPIDMKIFVENTALKNNCSQAQIVMRALTLYMANWERWLK